MGKDSQPLPIRKWVLGSVVSSLSGVLDRDPTAERFSCILETPGGLSWNVLGANFFGVGMVLLAPLNSPMSLIVALAVDMRATTSDSRWLCGGVVWTA